MNKRSLGEAGEDRAVGYLVGNGYRIVSRNYQTRTGEIDCIAEAPDGTLVFVEVKSARSLTCGHPLHWVTPAKQHKLRKMAQRYLLDHDLFGKRACRFDVVALSPASIDHLKNAFVG